MKFNIRGNKVEITEPIRKYVEEKIGRLDKYFENPGSLTANVLVRIRGIDQIVEVTIPAKKMILRGEERNKDLYAAIDLVSDKIERQIRKNKTRMQKKATKPSMIDFNMNFEAEENEPEETVVKRKKIEMKPMSEEEAILQMNLIGHEFFVFKDADTGEVCILYKRKDGGYGMIETN
ncbi:MAG TPA: ribosome-associated translation inhibitor RaiA [Candidatus Fimihabitans intestinipullorum]|uniref:Ribosome hibernation promoting factor n=1 Tax=Candidatus Fimihabitans intestinipullorum TaxID=2840820 RepID=A0A9D1HSX6_9BACT|nr:ribosome-associated translation inhibitor RaiA [Candidatus Fimihabitans intestinipullorum]